MPSYQGGIFEHSLGNSVELVSRYFFITLWRLIFCFLEECLEVSHLVSQEAGKRLIFCDSGSAQSRPLLGGNLSPRQTPILWTAPTKTGCIGLYFVRPYNNSTCTGSTIVFFISVWIGIVLSWDWELWIPQTQVDAGKAFKSSCVEKESARRIARWEAPKAVKGKSEHASVASGPKTEELCATFWDVVYGIVQPR